jgi:hypothetical protein
MGLHVQFFGQMGSTWSPKLKSSVRVIELGAPCSILRPDGFDMEPHVEVVRPFDPTWGSMSNLRAPGPSIAFSYRL